MNDESLRAEHDIRALVAELAIPGRHRELEDYLVCFTDDAVWEVQANDAAGVPPAFCEGHDEIAASVRQRRAMGVQGPGTGTMHHITTQHIVVSGEAASGYIYYQFVGMVDRTPTIRTLGRYRDIYRCTSHGWKLARRTILIS